MDRVENGLTRGRFLRRSVSKTAKVVPFKRRRLQLGNTFSALIARVASYCQLSTPIAASCGRFKYQTLSEPLIMVNIS